MDARRWLGRLAAGLVLVLAVLVTISAFETGSAWLFLLSADGFGGALLLASGVERPDHPLARRARTIGWAMMLAFTLVPTSLLFLPALVVLLALPAALGDGVTRRPGTGATGSLAAGPS